MTSSRSIAPKVSILVVNTNELAHLKDCLPSLFLQTYPDYEVIVIDNGSIDGSQEYIEKEFPQVTLIKNAHNLGYAGANNVGFDAAKGDYIAVLNPDTRVEPDWLDRIIFDLEARPSAGLATPKILLWDQPGWINTCGNDISFAGLAFCRGLDQPKGQYALSQVVSAVSGAAFVIKRSVLQEIGKFDEHFFIYYEDTDLSLRAALAGYQCIFVPDAVVYHKYVFKFSSCKAFYQERNRYYSWLKVFRWPTLIVLLPSLIIGDLISWGYTIKHGKEHIISKLQSILWLFAHRQEVFDSRARVQKTRTVPDREIIKGFQYRINFSRTVRRWQARLMDVLITPILYLLSRIELLLIWW